MPVYSVTPYIRNNGKVYLRVLVSSEKKRYSTGVAGNIRFFNNDTGEFSSRSTDADKNSIIQQKKSEILNLLKQLELEKGDGFTVSDFHRIYFHKQNKQTSVTEFIRAESKLRKKSSFRTLQIYETTARHIDKFRPGIKLSEVDYDFLSRFHAWMMTDQLNRKGEVERKAMSNNTANMYLRKLRVFIRQAINKGILKESDYPFRRFEMRNTPTNPDFLEEEQVRKLMNLENLPPHLDELRRKFIFQCYTGLRYSDLIRLEWSAIRNDCIILTQKKVSDLVTIPLVENARKIIGEAPADLSQRIFKPVTNQTYNYYLKDLAKLAKLNIHLTTHVARHTFATLALTYGISMETVRDLLGHKDLKTTQIYGRIVDKKKQEEMKKFRL